MELNIEGLTEKQVRMLQKFWSCENEEQFSEWFVTLSYADKKEMESLVEVVRLEVLEEIVRISDLNEANEMIERVKNVK